MPSRRRLLTWVVLALVVVLGGALGRATPAPAAESGAAAGATHVTGVTHVAGDHANHADPHHADHGEQPGDPCVVRVDCGGAWAFGAAGLLLAVAVTVPAIGFVPTVRRVAAAPTVLHSALLPSGLFRPPQPS